jgi:type IV secretion system protein VirB5
LPFAGAVKKHQEGLTLADREAKERETIESNPWLNAKARRMDVYLAQSQNTAQWRLTALIMTLLLALSVAGNIYLSTAVKVQPYVVQVDEHGYAIPVEMAETSGVSERVIASQIGQFIQNSRIRVNDKRTQIYFAGNAYKSIAGDSQAMKTLDSYFQSDPPTDSKALVSVEIKSIIPLSPATYQAEWDEITRTERSNTKLTYQGLYEVALSPPKDMQNLVNNPMGIYITDYHIQQKIQ